MVSLSILCQKDIISISTGQNIGKPDDIEFDEKTARIENLIVYGRPKFLGLFGRGKDIKIPWNDVMTVGQDVILIRAQEIKDSEKRGKINVEYT